MSQLSSSSDSEASSSSEETPKATTHAQRLVRRYNEKTSLITEKIFGIEQDNDNLVQRIEEVKALVKDGVRHRAAIMAKLDSYGDDYRSVPVIIPSEAEAASAVRATQPSILSDKRGPKSPKKKKTKQAADSSEAQSGAEDQNGETQKSKKPRDPAMPKRPHNAFFYYSQERRPAMQRQNPNLTKKEIAAVLAERWKELPMAEKQIYLQLQDDRKRHYQTVMAQYKESHQEETTD